MYGAIKAVTVLKADFEKMPVRTPFSPGPVLTARSSLPLH